jgi:hypothetical protein
MDDMGKQLITFTPQSFSAQKNMAHLLHCVIGFDASRGPVLPSTISGFAVSIVRPSRHRGPC